jgi:hypothetical protein
MEDKKLTLSTEEVIEAIRDFLKKKYPDFPSENICTAFFNDEKRKAVECLVEQI